MSSLWDFALWKEPELQGSIRGATGRGPRCSRKTGLPVRDPVSVSALPYPSLLQVGGRKPTKQPMQPERNGISGTARPSQCCRGRGSSGQPPGLRSQPSVRAWPQVRPPSLSGGGFAVCLHGAIPKWVLDPKMREYFASGIDFLMGKTRNQQPSAFKEGFVGSSLSGLIHPHRLQGGSVVS